MKGTYGDIDSYWNGNVMHLPVQNFEEFNELLKKVADAKQEFDKALHKLSCFDIGIVFDDFRISGSDWTMLRLSVGNLEEFNKSLKDTEKAEQALNKAMHDLSCFNLRVVLDEAKASG